jgi:4-hydroxyphenylpyruvate dioxygenase
VERKNYKGLFLPGYQKLETSYNPTETGLLYVDHCVGNVGWHKMNEWVNFYEEVLGFKNILTFDDKMISTEYSALMSKVMSNGNGYVKFPINEPAEGKKKSQIEEYLEFYEDEGVQHLALATHDIVATVTELQSRGVEFLTVPHLYYDELTDRVGHIDEDLEPLKKLGILVDGTTKATCCKFSPNLLKTGLPFSSRSSSVKGAKSFGAGNFKALFEAIEREQDLRGNL